MIAIFSNNNRDFSHLNMSPEKEFIKVRDIDSISGRKFTGYILSLDWYKSEKLIRAYEALQKRQPELFIIK